MRESSSDAEQYNCIMLTSQGVPTVFLSTPITRNPANSNRFSFPFRVRVSGVLLYFLSPDANALLLLCFLGVHRQEHPTRIIGPLLFLWLWLLPVYYFC